MNKLKLVLGSSIGVAMGVLGTLLAHAQSIPTVGTTDIATIGGAVLSPLVVDSEYIMQYFGPPLLALGLLYLVYRVIRGYVARRHPSL